MADHTSSNSKAPAELTTEVTSETMMVDWAPGMSMDSDGRVLRFVRQRRALLCFDLLGRYVWFVASVV